MIGLRLTRNCHWSWPGTYHYVDPRDIVNYLVTDLSFPQKTTVLMRDGTWFRTVDTPVQISRLIEPCRRQRVAA